MSFSFKVPRKIRIRVCLFRAVCAINVDTASVPQMKSRRSFLLAPVTMTFIYLRARDGLRTVFVTIFPVFVLCSPSGSFSFSSDRGKTHFESQYESEKAKTPSTRAKKRRLFPYKNVPAMKNRYENIPADVTCGKISSFAHENFPPFSGAHEVPTRLSVLSAIHQIHHESLAS
jgi:hypothetical protein